MSDEIGAARVDLLDDIRAHKADWYRQRKAGAVLGPLERHHDRWHWLVERDQPWPGVEPPGGI